MSVRARQFLVGILIATLSTIMLSVGTTSPAAAATATCRYSYNSDGFPVWSKSCSTSVSPGKFGSLKMGKTTTRTAKAKHYVVYNKFCYRWDGYTAYGDWRSKAGKVVAWKTTKTVTSKGLRTKDSLARAKRLYPSLKRTGYVPNEYIPGEGWRVYSVKGKYGWLDIYRYTAKSNGNFFAVRAKSVKKPITSWAQDGC